MKCDIRLARYDVRTGWLPQICPRHGAPATGTRKQKFSSKTPSWVFLLVLVALLLAMIVASCIAKTESAAVPTCDQCDGDRRQVRLLRYVSGPVSLALLTGAAAAASAVLALTGTLVLIIWLLSLSTAAAGMYSVRGHVVDDHWLDLRDVHPDFVAAIRPNPAWAFAQPAYGHVPQPAAWR